MSSVSMKINWPAGLCNNCVLVIKGNGKGADVRSGLIQLEKREVFHGGNLCGAVIHYPWLLPTVFSNYNNYLQPTFGLNCCKR